MEHAREWQIRPLQPVYAVVFMDAMMVKMRYEPKLTIALSPVLSYAPATASTISFVFSWLNHFGFRFRPASLPPYA